MVLITYFWPKYQLRSVFLRNIKHFALFFRRREKVQKFKTIQRHNIHWRRPHQQIHYIQQNNVFDGNSAIQANYY